MISYKESGVSIENGDLLTEIIRKDMKTDNIGNFAGLYEHPYIPEYYLAGCTDGVGTKVIPLSQRKKYETIAIDLIAMNLNDLICTGAKPLFFLDYFATNTLNVEAASAFILALRKELEKYGCTLLGGETAELGDLVKEGHFDVGGFMTGIVRKDKVLKKENVKEGDVIIALKSSGPHSNGYSLIRKLHDSGLLNDELFEAALEPTYIYANEVISLTERGAVHAAANITGGGIEGNLVRSIPEHLCAVVYKNKIIKQPLFEELQKLAGEDEAYKTFNMGVGLCLITDTARKDAVFETCKAYEPFVIGEVVKNEKNTNFCFG
ncbi:MAG: phosphoribosylformylglycinamidine cyclo-ligase [Heliobacteriaceae bacterium]|jgi:phosphoribosylformylglycinamidine cyclo-ligase|nr:phosphoribosylformylglycinamidine cyclo-ligase [Heliobacteriaceae bacterium]